MSLRYGTIRHRTIPGFAVFVVVNLEFEELWSVQWYGEGMDRTNGVFREKLEVSHAQAAREFWSVIISRKTSVAVFRNQRNRCFAERQISDCQGNSEFIATAIPRLQAC